MIALTNISGRPCTVQGFLGLAFGDAPAVTIDQAPTPPQLVMVAPKGKAETLVQVTHPDGVLDVGECKMPSALNIELPGETATLNALADAPHARDGVRVCANDHMTSRPMTAPAVISPAAAIPAGILDCNPEALEAGAFHSLAGNGMGHVGEEVWLANVSTSDCVLRGTPTVVPDDGSGTAQPACGTNCVPSTDSVIAIPAGAVVGASGSAVNGAGNESPCGTEQPLRATSVRVFLPHDGGIVTGPFGAALYCHGSLSVNDFKPL